LDQIKAADYTLKVIKEIDKYLNYSTGGSSRRMLFAKNRNIFSLWQDKVAKVFVPEEIIATVKKETKHSVFSG